MTTDEEHAFWDEIILNDDGTVDLEAVYRELKDFHFVMQQAAHVYYDITCGQMSRPNYYAADVVAVANECTDKMIRDEILSVLLDISDGTVTLEEAIRDHMEDTSPDVQTTDDGI